VTLGCATNLGMAKQGMAPQDASSNPLVLQVEDPIFDGGTHDDYVRRVEQAGFLPVSPLSSDVRERFEAIAREDQYEGAPVTITAAAILIDGTYLPRVNFIPERLVRQWSLAFWKRYVKPESVADVRPSPNRIPLPYRRGIWFVGETSMGNLSFVVTLKDGGKFGCLYPSANDLIALPEPYTPSDIVDIDIGFGLAKAQKVVLKEPDFVWCPYNESPEGQLERAWRTRNVLDLEEIGMTQANPVALRLRAENWLLVIGANVSNSWRLRSAAKEAAVRVRESLPQLH